MTPFCSGHAVPPSSSLRLIPFGSFRIIPKFQFVLVGLNLLKRFGGGRKGLSERAGSGIFKSMANAFSLGRLNI
jgi:hypothetical protein